MILGPGGDDEPGDERVQSFAHNQVPENGLDESLELSFITPQNY